MDRRRTAWLVAAPLLAGTAALMLGAAAASALAVVLTPYETPAPALLDAGRGVLASTFGDLTDLRQLAPVAAGVLLAELTWMVGLGLGAQRLFPRRRRALPAFAAVVLSVLGAWVAIGLLAGAGGLWAVSVDDAVNAVLAASVASALVVFLSAGHQWPMAARAEPSAPPVAAPQARPTERPTARPVVRPAARPTVRPADRPTARSAARPKARPKAVTATRPAGLL